MHPVAELGGNYSKAVSKRTETTKRVERMDGWNVLTRPRASTVPSMTPPIGEPTHTPHE